MQISQTGRYFSVFFIIVNACNLIEIIGKIIEYNKIIPYYLIWKCVIPCKIQNII